MNLVSLLSNYTTHAKQMKFNYLAATLLFGAITYAQDGKIIKGHIYDATHEKQPLAYASVMLKNTDFGAETDENGYFEIEVPDGEYQLEASYTGYQTFVMNCSTTDLNALAINLTSEDMKLDEVVIRVDKRKSTEAALLNNQRKSLEIKQEIGAQELAKKGVSDVASAVTKTSGVTKQESTGGIFVRGLGDRYNSTTMNGLPVVSNDPEKKNIDLNLFSTDIVDFISIDKTYAVRNSGDFAGGNVDINSKKHNGEPTFSVTVGASGNTNALGENDFLLQEGRSKLGFNKNNKIPNDPLGGYNFATPLKTYNAVPFGSGIGVNGGRSFLIGDEGKLNLFATASFENDYGFKEGIDKQVSAQNARVKDFYHKKYSYSTKSTGMFNANYDINANTSIDYNFLFVNASNQTHDDYRGYIRDIAESTTGGILTRNNYVENRLMAHQLLGNHKIADNQSFKWGASFNSIKSYMPDRTQTILRYREDENDYVLASNSASDNHRYFHDLKENEIAFNAAYDYQFNKLEDEIYKGKLTVGYNGKMKKREFNARQFNFDIASSEMQIGRDVSNLDAFFNQQNFQNGLFDISTFRGDNNALEPQYYNGDLDVHAAFANVDYQLTPKLFAVVGLRYETIRQNIDWKTQLDNVGGSDLYEKNAFLPSLNLKYELTGNQNLRFAASKTYTMPQFKERAPFIYEDVTEIKYGNKDLYASDNYNVDIKWEMFPQNDEVMSATVFGKYIKNPINETNIASAANDISYLNTGDYGYAAGLEIELRKNLVYFNNNDNNKLSFGLNAAYMKTDQELNSDKIKAETGFNTLFTNDKAAFTGASAFLGNADLTYYKAWENKNVMATLAYNYNSDKLYAIGVEQKGNLVDKGFGMLDFILKTKFNENFGLGLSAKNLLNPSIDRVQENTSGDVLVRSYKLGSTFSVSLNYNF